MDKLRVAIVRFDNAASKMLFFFLVFCHAMSGEAEEDGEWDAHFDFGSLLSWKLWWLSWKLWWLLWKLWWLYEVEVVVVV